MSENTKLRFKELLIELLDLPDEDREEEICDLLDQISPDPNYSDYIYYSEEFSLEDGGFDFDGMIEKVFSYVPIAL